MVLRLSFKPDDVSREVLDDFTMEMNCSRSTGLVRQQLAGSYV
jgi:hypothetical protein